VSRTDDAYIDQMNNTNARLEALEAEVGFREGEAVVLGGKILSLRARVAELEAAVEQALIGLCGVTDSPQHGDLESLRNYLRAALAKGEGNGNGT